MKTKRLAAVLLVLFVSCGENNNPEYNNMTRVEIAYHENYDFLKNELGEKGITFENLEIFIRAFKQEEIVELWAKNNTDDFFVEIKKYTFCKSSGKLGPKRKEGDGQIPEGFYHIDRFNPNSKFYLSLGLNYPNGSDLILSDHEKPGNDIFIHGGCATVGCIPIVNEKIKELFVLASEARKNGQEKIPVHTFPFKMTDDNINKYQKGNLQHQLFWKDLQVGLMYFEKNKKVPEMSVLKNGRYFLSI